MSKVLRRDFYWSNNGADVVVAGSGEGSANKLAGGNRAVLVDNNGADFVVGDYVEYAIAGDDDVFVGFGDFVFEDAGSGCDANDGEVAEGAGDGEDPADAIVHYEGAAISQAFHFASLVGFVIVAEWDDAGIRANNEGARVADVCGNDL